MRPDLDAIRARCEAASGPAWTWETDDWTTTRRSSVSRIISMDAIRARQESGIETSARLPYLATVYGDADTAFIAHARTDIPALLAYVEELTQERDEARAEAEHAYREGGALYEAKIAEREAFRRGAEAMREACLGVVERFMDFGSPHPGMIAHKMSAQPIPEEP